ncbi:MULTISPECIES: cupredoxin domain-containing protein [Rhodopseudomonas]|uniref:cupredoxin domain-containing protein n=1 Tax=Rhodopseudomonas TaxID=1073 RepID=UPI000697B6C6|nr:MULTISPECIES: cupredoxin domain-containing protein [Rhodopseudomonas]MDF3811567.1 cupredoxin domain-containing protein [Rhodopseudomonas sp. BAL398]WOK19391.1 cupredoxin domain-containing protein [Rhodopseudomonas sp. BAL398]
MSLKAKPGRRAAAAPLCVLLLAGATPGVAAETPFGPVAVVVTAKACEPNELKVPAGLVVFQITNRSSRALEWEILKGVMVIDERENIAPGFRQKMTTRLEPGEYEITCGLLDNPRGRLTVVNAAGTTAANVQKPSATDLIGPVAEYRVWLAGELSSLDAAAAALAAAVAAGDVAAVGARWSEVRGGLLQLAPIAPLIEAETRAVAADLVAIGPAIVDGGTLGRLAPASATLRTDVAAFRRAARALTPAPDRLIAGAAAAAKALAEILGGTAPVDLAEADARLRGAVRVVELFGPLTERADSAAAAELNAAAASLRQALTKAGEAPRGAALGDDDRRVMVRAADDFARCSARLPAILGL